MYPAILPVTFLIVADVAEKPERINPPDLPKPLADLGPSVIVCTGLWVVALLVLLVMSYLGHDVGVWIATCVAGIACGGFGLSIVAWQRAASRRGSRGAQRGL